MAKEGDDKERIAIDELKKRLRDVPENEFYEGDHLFYRFLKARDFNIDSAEKMLREHLEWRKKYDANHISDWKLPEVFQKYFPYNKLGYDKEGCVVRYVPSGSIDWKGLYASCKLEDYTKCLIRYFEEDYEDLRKRHEKTGKGMKQFFFIHNLENFPLSQGTNKTVVMNALLYANLYVNNYPETLRRGFIINASIYFHLMFSVVKKILPSTILDKIHIYSDDSWKEDLAKLMDVEDIPVFLGGQKTDPDGNPLCNTFINHAGPVPQEYYIHRSKRSLASLPDVRRLTLDRASFEEIFLEVEEPGNYLEWEFETESRDVGLGLFHQGRGWEQREIVPIQKVNTDEYAETGLYKCEHAGKYVIVFDNTYSVLRKKDIFYRIKIVKPRGESLISN